MQGLFQVDDEKGEKYLVSMPRKFRETIYVKRGSFVFVVPIKEGVKVKGEITQILDNENVLYLREQKIWPKRLLFISYKFHLMKFHHLYYFIIFIDFCSKIYIFAYCNVRCGTLHSVALDRGSERELKYIKVGLV